MSSSREYLDFVLDQLSGLKEITFRQMMGEYIIYYHGKIIGGIYDDRFLVKLTKSAKEKMPDVTIKEGDFRHDPFGDGGVLREILDACR